MSPANNNSLRRTLGQGVAWNLASFAVIGFAGLAINLLIARFYEPWVLGVFNLVLAVFIYGGQLGAFAIQYSVLYHTPRSLARGQPSGDVLSSALLLSAMISAPVAAAVWACSAWLAGVFESPAAAEALALTAAGLLLFPLNKILLAYSNGRREMRLYAIGNAGRSLVVLIVVGAFVVRGLDGAYIAVSLSVAEGVLFVAMLFAHRADLRRIESRQWQRWRRRHLAFGSRGVLGGILFELNTRIDVFALAFLADMKAVGVYSMASIFAEGLFQLLIVLRYNYDPVIARLVAEKRTDALMNLVRSGRRIGYAVMLPVGVVAIALYPWVVRFLVQRDDYDASWLVFAILAGGIILAAGYVPFSGFLQQAGHPAAQSVLIAAVMLTNLVGNLWFIPGYGVVGAAVATAISQVAYVPFLKGLVRRRIGIRI